MPKIRHLIATAVVALTAPFLVGVAPAHADMVSKGCDYAVSGWSNAKVCITVTYHQPTASKYQIDKVKVEAFDIADTKRVDFSLILWDDDAAPGWDRLDQKLNADNGWDKVYTPTDLYVTVAGNNDGISCWGNAFFDAGGSGFFSTGAAI
jgi:hypothetical protein